MPGGARRSMTRSGTRLRGVSRKPLECSLQWRGYAIGHLLQTRAIIALNTHTNTHTDRPRHTRTLTLARDGPTQSHHWKSRNLPSLFWYDRMVRVLKPLQVNWTTESIVRSQHERCEGQ